MTFPNAHEGVKKIYFSQILTLIVGALGILAAIFALIGAAALLKSSEALAGTMGILVLLFGIGAAVLAIVALVYYIMGINRAKLDEPTFTKALICVVVSIVCAVLSAFFTKNAVVKNIIVIVQDIANLLATVFIIFGIQALAKKLDRPDIEDLGKKLLYIIIAVYALDLITSILAAIFGGIASMKVAGNVVSTISAVLSLASTVIYLIFLHRATKMLEA